MYVAVKGGERAIDTDQGQKIVYIVDKDLGYELRSADPIPFDAEYTRDLGYGAARGAWPVQPQWPRTALSRKTSSLQVVTVTRSFTR